jgi:hypothetical protein
VGPFKPPAFKTSTPQTEKLFVASFANGLQKDGQMTTEERTASEVLLVNDNFDTGTVTTPGQYPLADKTYADLMDRLQKNNFDTVSPDLNRVLLAYYGDLNAPFATKKNKKEWARVVLEVDELKKLNRGEVSAIDE